MFILNFYLVILCIMAFFYIPAETADLFRLRKMSDAWAKLSLSSFLNSGLLKTSIPISRLIMYACGKTGIDGLMPMLSALIFYSNTFYILKDLFRNHDATPKGLAIGLLLLMSSDIFLEVISGIRCFTALSILARCFYMEVFNGKNVIKNVIWCVVAALMHNIALVLYVIRVIMLIFSREKVLLNILSVTAILSVMAIFGAEYIEAAAKKAFNYIYGDAYSYSWGYVINILNLIIIFVSLPCPQNHASEINNPTGKKMRTLTLIFSLIATALCFEYSIFHRTITFATIMLIPLVVMNIEFGKRRNYQTFVKLASLLLLVTSCTRGNLCGYKFFLLR